jgi:hypothetical protein
MRHVRRTWRALGGRLLLAPAFALSISAWPAIAQAAKTDVLVLLNGDRITGDVKSLSRGKLDYSTDDAGRLSIEWIKVARLSSTHEFEVEVESGAKHFGRLSASDRDGTLIVEGLRVDSLAIPSVVRINTLNAGFFQRVKAYLDVGFSFAKANQATTLNSAGEAAYRGNKYGSKLGFDSYAQGQESVETTTRNSAWLQATRYLPNRWSAVGIARTEQNDELDLELRFTGAAALGRILMQSNSSELGVGGGLAVTQERYSRSEDGESVSGESNTSLEALIVGVWDAFRFDSPSLDFSTSLYLYPSLSNPGRIRGEATMRLKYELFPDFDVGISATDTFDSEPLEVSATKNDFITSFTIGWSYRR